MPQRAQLRPRPQSRITIDVHLEDSDTEEVLEELRQGLTATPRRIPSKYFYDDRGSELFERICELPEYYQTRTERALLQDIASQIVATTGAHELVELGSGAATKTRVLLDAMFEAGQLWAYMPLDVSEATVRRVAEELVDEYSDLIVHGVVGDFMKHLERIPPGNRRLVIFLGGTIGNLDPETEAVEFLSAMTAQLAPEDFFLLGTDLIKDVEVVTAAYNDSQGVTAEFNRNSLRVLNTVLDADFEPHAFAHRAPYNLSHHRIEMWLTSTRRQRVRLRALDLVIDLEEGEEILTEISTKYDQARVERLLGTSGLELVEWFTDPEARFGLSLARRAGSV